MRAFTGFTHFLFHNRLSITHPRFFAFFTASCASTSLPIACAGFCWGGKLVAQLCAASARTEDGKKFLVDCGFMAHPANLAVPADVEAVQQQLSISIGDVDFALEVAQVQECKRVLEEGEEKGRYELVILEGVN
jgi:dienelactone hydrolase